MYQQHVHVISAPTVEELNEKINHFTGKLNPDETITGISCSGTGVDYIVTILFHKIVKK